MGRNKQESKVNWIGITIEVGSFLRYIMDDLGYGLDSGIIFVADDDMQARQFIRGCCQKGGIGQSISGWKKRRAYPLNYCCGIMAMKKGVKEEEAEDFLSEKEFLPVIVCGGLFPDYLKTDHYIFRMKKGDIEDILAPEFAAEMQRFREYIIENLDRVCEVINQLDSSIAVNEYQGDEEFRQIHTFLMGLGAVYSDYLRKTQSERTTSDFFQTYKGETLERLSRMKEFASGMVLKEMLAHVVWEYLYVENDVTVADVDEIDDEIYAAVKAQRVILYDDKIYYCSPQLLMKMCAPLLQTVSEVELKRRLCEEGILFSNSVDYTVKKTIVNSFGIPERPRFLWVYKEALMSPENFRLEDIFYEKKEEGAICIT